ncbi:MAG: thiamine ABC transporter substrate-binding protein [Treponema sp.]|jgi:thiamine transport system substrate-binding protein|nr:thiamine ABC transporter substrate-binding protein [Treponema sp.]
MYRKHHPSRGRLLFLAALFVSFTVSLVFAGGNKEKSSPSTQGTAAAKQEVVIWTYDSFNSEWGPGPEVTKRFLAETGITLRWVSHGDAGEVLSRLLLEGNQAGADIILGLDQNLADKALGSGLLEAYKPKGMEKVFPELVIDETYRLIPLDYSYFAIVYDSEKILDPPRSLEDLTAEKYAKGLILMDPRTSSPGLGFLAWTQAVYGDAWKGYWQRLAPTILTIADGWSAGYGLFTAGEAPLVLSYTTSPGYHLEYEGTERYKAALFTEGHPIQIEVAGILTAGKNKEQAKGFLDFMLSPAFQDIIPLTNWMYPVITIPLPESFRITPKSDKPLRPRPVTDAELTAWAALVVQTAGQ